MNEGFLNHSDVKQLIELIQKMDESSFDSLLIENKDLKIVISKGDLAQIETLPTESNTAQAPAPRETTTTAPIETVTPEQATEQPPSVAPTAEGLLEIKSPTAGLFFAQSEPGADPYVTVGSQVDENTTVGLVEVMKVFTAVPAGVKGTIVEICVEDAQFVEYGQTLFRVKP